MRYEFKRRSFIEGVGAAFGLHTLLRNAESFAQGMSAAKRLLVTHHPIGVIRYAWQPTGSGTTYTTSTTLKPFEDAGLRPDMIIVDGLDMSVLGGPGGGHEKGTVTMMTAARTYGTRTGQTETDDAMAAFPSMDQIILAIRTQDLGARPFKSIYALCDDRIDFQEISTRCLRYDMATRAATAAANQFPSGTAPYENTPMRATLKPLDLYTSIFGSMMTGGTTGSNTTGSMSTTGTTGRGTTGTTTGGTSVSTTGAANISNLTRAFYSRKSVLDFSLSELARLRTLAPSSSKAMLDAHEQAIREMENRLQAQYNIDNGSSTGNTTGMGTTGTGTTGGSTGGTTGTSGGTTGGPMGGACVKPTAPSSALSPGIDNGKDHNNYNGNEAGTVDEAANHQAVGEAHQAIIMAAFQCDLTRVALFQWSPGTNHVSFKGMYPGSTTSIFMHHPISHRLGAINASNNDAVFCANIETWYNTRHAEFMNKLKATKDILDPNGGSLLDNTVIPYLTEVASPTHNTNNMGLAFFGGKNLGFHGGQYYKSTRPFTDYWLTIAASLGVTIADLQAITVNGIKGAPILREAYQGVLPTIYG